MVTTVSPATPARQGFTFCHEEATAKWKEGSALCVFAAADAVTTTEGQYGANATTLANKHIHNEQHQ